MENNKDKVAELLLQSKSIKLEPTNPFTWASGWKSPIYCDNRKILSFPRVRDYVKELIISEISKNYPGTQLIAGVATGAIGIAAIIADELNLPMVYVRPSPKKHGLENQIEGFLHEKLDVLVIEDLISTGGSSMNAINALRAAKANILGMIAIFTYGFEIAKNRFSQENVKWQTLSNYDILLKVAQKKNKITKEQLSTLKNWKKDPSKWTP